MNEPLTTERRLMTVYPGGFDQFSTIQSVVWQRELTADAPAVASDQLVQRSRRTAGTDRDKLQVAFGVAENTPAYCRGTGGRTRRLQAAEDGWNPKAKQDRD